MNVKYFLFLLIPFLLTGCDKNDDLPMEVSLPISREFIPVSVTFEKTDTEAAEKYRPWNDKTFTVNSASELPDDPIGIPDWYSKIDFENYTVLIHYRLHSFTIRSYSNIFYRNTVERTYNWIISLGIEDDDDERGTDVALTRFCIMVPKLPADAKVLFWSSHTSLGDFTES
ncbi:MAG: hypothetical protein J6C81_03040 [Muribaculaceae bacterium]|nr:hypothetical protein [Muribaculaceae bacterium]